MKLGYLLLGASLLAACASEPDDPVDAVLYRLETAAEERDADAFTKELAPSFQGEGGLGRAAASAEVNRWLRLYEGIDVTISQVKKEALPNGTRVKFRADFSGRPKDLPGLQGLLPGASAFSFVVDLERAGDAMAVTRAEWERVPFPGDAPTGGEPTGDGPPEGGS